MSRRGVGMNLDLLNIYTGTSELAEASLKLNKVLSTTLLYKYTNI
jgi:hypothetical protein